ncbi:hypothetical protein R5R35_008890 [Gryllus longicercus]|uniref:Uncharacterized protein n=1 Tax=Gryllus longicercus TaxID=2509291 RepID=A0AAN9YT98_9ORTH
MEDTESPNGQVSVATETPQMNYTRYRRYHANDSLIGQPVPCSRPEKLCFQHNLLYSPTWNKCVALGDAGGNDCEFVADKNEFLHGSGHLVAVCDAQPLQHCPKRLGVRMAWDGECYAHSLVRDELCACAELPTLHPLGGRECRCHSPTPSPPAR